MKRIAFIALFSLACMVSGFSQEARIRKADWHFGRLEYSQALKIYEHIAQKHDSIAHVLERLADCYRLTNQPVAAEIWYKKALDRGAKNPQLCYNYHLVLKNNKKYAEADAWHKEYLALKGAETIVGQDPYTLIAKLKADSARILIAPVEINTQYTEFGAAYYGDQMVFSSSRVKTEALKSKYAWNDEPFLDLYLANRNNDDSLTRITDFSPELNSPFHEGPVVFSSDLKTIYFTRNNYLVRGKDENRVNRLKIYTSSLENGKWKQQAELPFNSADFSCGHPALAADNRTLIFSSDMPGGFGNTDLYVTEFNGGSWSTPRNLGGVVNSEGNEMFPFIHPDGTLFFSSTGHLGLGGLDIFYSLPDENGNYTSPVNVGYPLNSSLDDFAFVLGNDKIKGYLSSNRTDFQDDIFRFVIMPKPPLAIKDSLTTFKNARFIKIPPMKNDLVGDCKLIYISEFAPKSTSGGEVITGADSSILIYTPTTDFFGIDTIPYTICDTISRFRGCSKSLIIINVLNRNFVVKGTVTDKFTKELLPDARVLLKKVSTGDTTEFFTASDGKYLFNLEENTDYELWFSKEYYYPFTATITTRNMTSDTIVQDAPLEMMPYLLECKVVYKGSEMPVPDVDVRLFTTEAIKMGEAKTDTAGMCSFGLEARSSYYVYFQNDSFFNKTVSVTTQDKKPGTIRVKEVIELEPKQLGLAFSLNIYFDLSKWNIRPDAKKELDEKLLTFLNNNPSIKIELSAHTDSRGSAESNETLSQKRAESAVNYLISQGIDPNRLVAKGYGEYRLVNGCKDGVRCTEKQHQENRRVEITVLEY